jgi:phosphate transporter
MRLKMAQRGDDVAAMRTPLISRSSSPSQADEATRGAFFREIEHNIHSVNSFFSTKRHELRERFDVLDAQVHKLLTPSPDSKSELAPSEYALLNSERVSDGSWLDASLSKTATRAAWAKHKQLRQELLHLYKQARDLRMYRDLNYNALWKAMKKLDKLLGEQNEPEFVARLKAEPFMAALELDEMLLLMQGTFQRLTNEASLEDAFQLWETQELDTAGVTIVAKWRWLLLGLAAMAVLLAVPLFPSHPRARRCLAMLVAVMVWWVTEAVPFFVTGLAIPFLAVVLRVLGDSKGEELSAEDAANTAFSKMFNSTTSLVLGGFALQAVFCKFHFELWMAQRIQQMFGRRPTLFILAYMLFGFFLSMWISNVAAPVLCTAVLLPTIRDFSRKSRFNRTILLGLAFACNLGGMLSPIASPQNAYAINYLNDNAPEHAISFLQWCLVAVPYGLVCLLSTWAYLVYVMRPRDVAEVPDIVYEQPPLGRMHVAVLLTTVVTIVGWCTLQATKPVFGSMGIVGLVPLVALFGSGILTKDDLLTFSWNLILLIAGGNVLGEAVRSSHLLQLVVDGISPALSHESLWVATLTVAVSVLALATFVSHTVAAIVLIPVILDVAVKVDHVRVLVMSAAFMMSAPMSFPMTSFPNLNSLLTVDDYDMPYLHVADFVRHGTPNSLIALVWLVTVGYGIMVAMFGVEG